MTTDSGRGSAADRGSCAAPATVMGSRFGRKAVAKPAPALHGRLERLRSQVTSGPGVTVRLTAEQDGEVIHAARVDARGACFGAGVRLPGTRVGPSDRVANEVAGAAAHRETMAYRGRWTSVFIEYPELYAYYYYGETQAEPTAVDRVRLKTIAELQSDLMEQGPPHESATGGI